MTQVHKVYIYLQEMRSTTYLCNKQYYTNTMMEREGTRLGMTRLSLVTQQENGNTESSTSLP